MIIPLATFGGALTFPGDKYIMATYKKAARGVGGGACGASQGCQPPPLTLGESQLFLSGLT